MTPREKQKNTEKYTVLFFNKKNTVENKILKEELNFIEKVVDIPLTKDYFYIEDDTEDLTNFDSLK